MGRGVKKYIAVNSDRHGIISANEIAIAGSSAPKSLPCDSATSEALRAMVTENFSHSEFAIKITKYPTDAASELKNTVHTWYNGFPSRKKCLAV